jgi:hypothetical protein
MLASGKQKLKQKSIYLGFTHEAQRGLVLE